jgi:hypothetical protein
MTVIADIHWLVWGNILKSAPLWQQVKRFSNLSRWATVLFNSGVISFYYWSFLLDAYFAEWTNLNDILQVNLDSAIHQNVQQIKMFLKYFVIQLINLQFIWLLNIWRKLVGINVTCMCKSNFVLGWNCQSPNISLNSKEVACPEFKNCCFLDRLEGGKQWLVDFIMMVMRSHCWCLWREEVLMLAWWWRSELRLLNAIAPSGFIKY